MLVNSIKLEFFRNYKKQTFEFDDDTTIIVGPNGAGKTNILEAIVLLSTGRSTRVAIEKDLVNVDSQYARVIGNYDNGDKLEIGLQVNPNSSRIRKIYRVNGAPRSGAKFIGTSKTVYFAPEDIRLVAGSPSRRREYLDRVLSQTSKDYYSSLLKYNRIVKQRNKVLEQSQGQILHNIYRTQLEFWNDQLLLYGKIIQNARKNFFEFANEHLGEISKGLYQDSLSLELEYMPNYLSEAKLESVFRKELLRGTTQVGPHRDDFIFHLNKAGRVFDLKSYGSRGQQRTGILCLKVLELEYILSTTGVTPVLLMDDIFSELDSEYRSHVESIVKDHQTIITTADIHSVPFNLKKSAMIEL